MYLSLLVLASFPITSIGCQSDAADSGDTSSDPGDTSADVLIREVIATGIDAGSLLSAFSAGDSLIFAGGEILGHGGGFIARYSDGALCTEEGISDSALWWIHGQSEDDYWLSGENGTLLHSVGGNLTDESVATDKTFYGVFDDTQRVWAVAGDTTSSTGEIWVRDGGSWSLLLETQEPVFKAWCAEPGRCVFISPGVGRFVDGDLTITETATPDPDENLLTCSGRSFDDIWCVGGSQGSTIYHWDGTSWEDVDTTGLGLPLMGVWTAEGEDVWVSGNSGLTAWSDGNEWVNELPISVEPFHAVMKHGDDFFFAGGNLTTTSGDYYATIGHVGPTPIGTLTPTACP